MIFSAGDEVRMRVAAHRIGKLAHAVAIFSGCGPNIHSNIARAYRAWQTRNDEQLALDVPENRPMLLTGPCEHCGSSAGDEFHCPDCGIEIH